MGGAGFVGSNLALAFRERYPSADIVALDNLRRRGSELNLPLLRAHGVRFQHGDIRMPDDLTDLDGSFDVMIEASAEPSVLAGLSGSPAYVLQSNLIGTLNCLEFARKRVGAIVFLSTSRVYSIAPLRALAMHTNDSRFELDEHQPVAGVSKAGISEMFPVDTARSIYGATKLASELMIQEYVASYGVRAVINRCGVIAGPGQFGKVDQGVFTLWVAHHHFGLPLQYTGFGGQGHQVRDLLHPADLFELVTRQIDSISAVSGETYNIGGGLDVSTSMSELTVHCQAISGRSVDIASNVETSPVDIPLYITDYRRANERFDWQPTRNVAAIVSSIAEWLRSNEHTLRPLFV